MHKNGTLQTADQQKIEATAVASCCASGSASGALNKSYSDVTTNTQSGVSSPSPKTCHCMKQHSGNTNASTTTIMSTMRNANHTTTPATTTTTIEYELSNGVAKLCKISTSRIAAEQQPKQPLANPTNNVLNFTTSATADLLSAEKENETASSLPLLTPADLKDLTRNVNAINAFNQNLNYTVSQSPFTHLQQRANFTMSMTNSGTITYAARDRLGLWGSGGDNDVPGRVSGLERLQKTKYNKVIKIF